ncbi:hypothetical protein Tco_1153355 [Tanacetum coccineum]
MWGGLMFVVEWASRENALSSLKANISLLSRWINDLKIWDDRNEVPGRLAWVKLEGILTVANSHNSVQRIASSLEFSGKLWGRYGSSGGFENCESDGCQNACVKEEGLGASSFPRGNASDAVFPRVEVDNMDVPKFSSNLNAVGPSVAKLLSTSPLRVEKPNISKQDSVVRPKDNDPPLNKNRPAHNVEEQVDAELEDLFTKFQKITECAMVAEIYISGAMDVDAMKRIGGNIGYAFGEGTNSVGFLLGSQSDVDFSFSGSIGACGGFLSMWNTKYFVKDQKLVGSSYLAVLGLWASINNRVGFLNVYGPQDVSEKECLWNILCGIISSSHVIWIVFGEFNAVRFR